MEIATEKKSKKTSSKSVEKKPKVDPGHPAFNEMIIQAIQALAERTGSSKIAITKWIVTKYPKVGDSKLAAIKVAQSLRRMLKSGTVVNSKGVGVAGSFKLPKALEKPKKKVSKSPAKTSSDKSKVKKTTKSKTEPKKEKASSVAKSSKKIKSPVKKVTKSKPASKSVKKEDKPKVTKSVTSRAKVIKSKSPVKSSTAVKSKSVKATPKKAVASKKKW